MYKSRARANHHSNLPLKLTELGSFLCSSLQVVASDLHILSVHLEGCRKGTQVSLDQIEYLEDTFASTVHTLTNFPYPVDMIEVVGKTPTTYYLQHAWRVAAYIYMDTFIRHNPDRRWISSCTSRRLIDALCETETLDWAPYQNVLLWILFVGFAAAREGEEKLWFVRQAEDVKGRLRLRAHNELLNMMKGQLWREDVLQGPLLELGILIRVACCPVSNTL